MAYVFFANGPRLRLWPRRTAYLSFLAWLTRRLTRCPWSHVSVGDQDVVLDPGIAGDRMFGVAWYIDQYPSLAWMVIAPTPRPLRLVEFAVIPPVPLRALPSLWWFLRGGSSAPRNCITLAAAVLRDAGINVPAVRSPGDLFDFLRSEGFELVDLSGDTDPEVLVGPADRDAGHGLGDLGQQGPAGGAEPASPGRPRPAQLRRGPSLCRR